MQSPPFPRYLVPPRSKYSPQHHVFKHPQLSFLPQCQRPSFTPTSLPLDLINSEDGYLKTEGIICSEFGKDRISSISATCVLHTFHKEQPSRISIDPQCQALEQKWCIFKATSPASPSMPDAALNRVRACSQSSP